MFTKLTTPDRIAIPLDAMAILHPSLPLWLRHDISVREPGTHFEARQKPHLQNMQVLYAETAVYYVSRGATDEKHGIGVFNFAISKDSLTIQYDLGHDRWEAGIGKAFAEIKIAHVKDKLGNAAHDYIAVDQVEFSKTFVDAIQKHFGTAEDINNKPLAERFLYFMFIGVLCQSEHISPRKETGFDNLMNCLEICGTRIDGLLRKHSTTLVDAFFTPAKLNDVDYLYFHPQVAAQIQDFTIKSAKQVVPDFIPIEPAPIRPDGTDILALPPPKAPEL